MYQEDHDCIIQIKADTKYLRDKIDELYIDKSCMDERLRKVEQDNAGTKKVLSIIAGIAGACVVVGVALLE